jgi:hydrogenase/urease accessory protein HupE
VPSGLLLMTILYVVILGIEAAMKRLRKAGLWTTVVYVLALIVGVAFKFGWVQPDLM